MRNNLEEILTKKKIYACIFARGGSKGVKRKNVKTLGDKPLISYSIDSARSNKYIDNVFVSTEDAEIAEIASEYGANIPFIRPVELATDHSPMWGVWQHMMNFFKENNDLPEIMIDLPCTSPFRSDEDISNVLKKLISDDYDAAITVCESKRHPMFNMVTENNDGSLQIAMKPKNPITRRQDGPKIYDIPTLAYAVRTEYIFSASNLFDGKIGAIIVPEERSLDIDTEFDFQLAENIIRI